MSTMRIGGLASGMDIDSLVEKLMVAERAPLDKLEQQKQIYEWQRDAYRSVNTKLTTLDTYIADNFILKSLNTKTATSSNSNLVEAKATASASGTLSIEGVIQLASAARRIGDMVKTTNGTVAKGSTKISELTNAQGAGFTGSKEFTILLKSIDSTGELAKEPKEIKFKASDTIDQVISKINSSKAGVVAFFENGKLSLTAENTGKLKDNNAAEVQLVTSHTTKDGKTITATGNDLFSILGVGERGSTNLVDGGTNAIFRVNGIDTERSSNTFSLNGYSITLKETFNTNQTLQNRINSLNELITATKAARDQINNQLPELENEVSEKEEVFNNLLSVHSDALSLSPEQKELFASLNKEQLNELLAITDVNEINTISFYTSELIGISSDDFESIKENIKRNIAYENLNNDSKTLLSSMSGVELAALAVADLSTVDGINNSSLSVEQKKVLEKLSEQQREILQDLSESNLNEIRNIINAENAYEIKKSELTAANANRDQAISEIAQYEQQLVDAENQLANTPLDENAKAVTLTATTNVDEIINKIKDFVQTYNGFVKELKSLTTESKYRDFKPLTTLQRKEMEDKEIELWEEKAKSGLLRNDSIIESALSSIRNLIYQSNPAISNSKYSTLFNVGITTSTDYTSGGTLEIDENKLRAALEDDPDSVTKLFTFDGNKDETFIVNGEEKKVDTRGFLRKLRSELDTIEKKIDERAGRGSMSENQFTLGKYLKDINKRIETWQDKLTEIEKRYWNQFTAMEKMINKANQQSTSLSSYFA